MRRDEREYWSDAAVSVNALPDHGIDAATVVADLREGRQERADQIDAVVTAAFSRRAPESQD